LNFIEGQAGRIDGTYLAEVEKLAAKTTDPALAAFYRATMKPKRILSGVQWVRRTLLDPGDTVAADQALDRLRVPLEFVDSQLQRRYFAIGIAQVLGGKNRAKDKANRTADRNIRMAHAYMEQVRTATCSPTALKTRIGKRHRLKRSAAVEAINAGLKKIPSGLGAKPDDD